MAGGEPGSKDSFLLLMKCVDPAMNSTMSMESTPDVNLERFLADICSMFLEWHRSNVYLGA
jgi:hypothetical protein